MDGWEKANAPRGRNLTAWKGRVEETHRKADEAKKQGKERYNFVFA